MAEGAVEVVTGADPFGAALKDHLVSYLKSKNIQVEDVGVDKYYNVGEQVGRRVTTAAAAAAEVGEDHVENDLKKEKNKKKQVRGIVVCGTGVGVSIFANKFKGIYATPCSSVPEAVNGRSINNSNVLTLGAVVTSPEQAEKIVDAWLSTPFKAACPANQNEPWSEEINTFLDNSLAEMEQIDGELKLKQQDHPDAAKSQSSCAVCALASDRKFEAVEIMPGGSWTILREDPTSAVVRFKAGSLEPAHHHTFGHDLIVMEGKKCVWNLTKNEVYNLGPGDFLYTPAGDVHRVQYVTDTEFFIRWDGHWDIFLDEDLESASAALKKDN